MFGSQVKIADKIIGSSKLIMLNNLANPLFDGITPEPIEKNMKNLSAVVRANKALAGFAFDGDADRIGVTDENGKIITPPLLFPVILKYLAQYKKLKGKVVQTVSMGYLSKKFAKAKGFKFEEVPVGFKNVSAKMTKEDILAGAEESGSYAWKTMSAERDGLASALIILEIITKSGKKLSQLVSDIEKEYGKSVFSRRDFKLAKQLPETAVFKKRIIRRLPKKILSMPIAEKIEVDGIKIVLENGHWFLIRPSGTENRMRIYAESSHQKTTDDLLNYAEKLVAVYLEK
jgi:phosphomannomutase